MSSCLFLGLLSFILATAGHYSTVTFMSSTEPLLIVALKGEAVVLPCGVPSVKSCSSITWNMGGHFGSIIEAVTIGGLTSGNRLRHELMEDCSLRISHLDLSDAKVYSCVSNSFNSSLSLQLLELIENSNSAEGTTELHCYLAKYIGYIACNNNTGIHMQWVAEDDSPLHGGRFAVKNPSECFSKLTITHKQTDHRRKWRCRLSQNDEPKATISYMTALKDGIEEVFSAVGDPVTLSCGTSSLGVGGSVDWVVCKKSPLNSTSVCSPTNRLPRKEDPQMVINKVMSGHAGNYTCSESTGLKKMLNNIQLHTLDIIVESDRGEDNFTLSCVLTCATECDKDFSLSWSENNPQSEQTPLMTVGDTRVKNLKLAVGSVRSEEVTCSVHREGVMVASKKWRYLSILQNPAWVVLPLCIVICAGIVGISIFMYMKKRYKRNQGDEDSRMAMTHVYDMIQDVTHEEQQQKNMSKREAITTTDSFYDLLQAVH